MRSLKTVPWYMWLMPLVGLALIGYGLRGMLLPPAPAAAPMSMEDELAQLRGLWLETLPPLPPDPSNAVADDPRAAALGQRLFFDMRLSARGQVSCAKCHRPEMQFQDGIQVAQGVANGTRRTMPIAGTAYNPWFFWDGRADSLWAQALGPLENPVEHGGTRTLYAHIVDKYYHAEYEALFGPLPDLTDRARFPGNAGPVADPVAAAQWESMAAADREAVTRVYVNIGKAIAAYERLLLPGPARFDRYVAARVAGDIAGAAAIFSPDEVAGMRLFLGRGQCINCHNGPLLTNNSFHNTGVPALASDEANEGRARGVQLALADPFNCLGSYSDAGAQDCAELRFVATSGHELKGAFKPPSLRNVAEREPYMHAGQFATLREVLDHYNRAPAAAVGHSELKPLGLSSAELAQLEAFLRTLSGPLNAAPELLHAPP